MIKTQKDMSDQFHRWVWKNPRGEGFVSFWFRRIVRLCVALAKDVQQGEINLRAMSLVYTTLLSLVPLLAISFSVLKGFGVHNQIEPALLKLLEPLGEKSHDITANIIGFVDNIQVGVLGTVGLLFLLYSVLSLLQKVERSFSDIWGIVHPRSMAARFSDYLSVLLIGPLLIFISIGMTASMRNTGIIEKITGIDVMNEAASHVAFLVPYIILTLAFAFIYAFIPNTKVRLGPALVAGAVSAALWKILGMVFAKFVSGSSNYTVIYSTFATLMFFMIWLYLVWMVVLIGASIAYYCQNPSNQVMAGRRLILSMRMRETVALAVCRLIADHFYNEKDFWTVDRLSRELRVPTQSIHRVLEALENQSIVESTHDTPMRYVPGKPFEEISVWDVLHAVRVDGEKPGMNLDVLRRHDDVDHVMGLLDGAGQTSLGKITVKDFLNMQTSKRKKKAPAKKKAAAKKAVTKKAK